MDSRISWETVKDHFTNTCRKDGAYSNATRGRLKKEEIQPEYHIIEGDACKGLHRSWARLIQKIYEVDPLLCPIYRGQMKIIAFI